MLGRKIKATRGKETLNLDGVKSLHLEDKIKRLVEDKEQVVQLWRAEEDPAAQSAGCPRRCPSPLEIHYPSWILQDWLPYALKPVYSSHHEKALAPKPCFISYTLISMHMPYSVSLSQASSMPKHSLSSSAKSPTVLNLFSHLPENISSSVAHILAPLGLEVEYAFLLVLFCF